MTVKPIPKISLAQRQFIVKTIEEQRRKKVANADKLVSTQEPVGITSQQLYSKLSGGVIRLKNPKAIITNKQIPLNMVFDLSQIEMKSAVNSFTCPRKQLVIDKINDKATSLKAKAMLGDPGDAEKLINNFIKWLPPKV